MSWKKHTVGRTVTTLGLCVLVSVAIFVLTGLHPTQGALLPGVTVEDEHPNGCVDCHANMGPNRDFRLNVSLGELEGHPPIDFIVKTLPDGCGLCHKEGTAAGPISLITHENHYHDADENNFISIYGGACLNCHSLDPSSGLVGMKSGPKNW
jgi:hypothetical protein